MRPTAIALRTRKADCLYSTCEERWTVVYDLGGFGDVVFVLCVGSIEAHSCPAGKGQDLAANRTMSGLLDYISLQRSRNSDYFLGSKGYIAGMESCPRRATPSRGTIESMFIRSPCLVYAP
jgi:hypothetical protein